MSNTLEIIGHDVNASQNKRRAVQLNDGGLKVFAPEFATLDQGINNLETYLDQVETKLTSIDTRIGDSVNVGTTEYGESANGRLNVYAYGRDASNGLMKPLKLDASGRLECSVDALEVTAETINLSTDNLEALIGQTNTKIDTADAVLDASLVKQTNIETLITSTNSKIDTADAVLDASLVKQTNIETLITSTNSKIDTADAVLDASLVKQTAIETLITTSNSVQDNVLTKLGEIETTNNANQVLLGTIDEDTNAIKGHVDGIETLITSTNSKIDTFDAVLDASLVKHTNNETLITAMSAKLPASLGAKSVANSISTCRDSDAGSYDMTARTTIGNASTTTALLCDSGGRLQVDVISGGGSTDVSALSTHAKQDTIIGHLDGVESKLDHLSDNIDTLDAVQDNALTKLTNIESLITTADAVLDASLVKQTNLETLITALDTVQDNALTKLTNNETLLTSIAPRTATATLSAATNLADGGALAIVDTDGYRYMTIFGKATNDIDLFIQYSLTNSAGAMISLYNETPYKLQSVSPINGIYTFNTTIEHMARYVRFINFSGSQVNALTLYYQLSN